MAGESLAIPARFWQSNLYPLAGLVLTVSLAAAVLPVMILNGYAHAKQAVAAAQAQKPAEARREFQIAVDRDPFTSSYAIDLARFSLTTGTKEGVEELAKKAISASPYNWQTRMYAAEIYANLGKPVEAARVAREGTALAP